MARPLSQLDALKVAKYTKPGMYSDGGGLYLRIGPTGSKSWVYRFMIDYHSHDMGLGATHTITLKKARELAGMAREAVLNGDNPIETRLVAKQRKKEARTITFQFCAEKLIASKRAGWKNAKPAENWEATLTKPDHVAQVHETLGPKPVRDIDRDMVLSILTREMPDGRTLWDAHPVMASELRRRIEKVLGWAKAEGHRQGENPATWKENLEHSLASPYKLQKNQHRPRATLGSYKNIGKVFILVGQSPSIAAPAGQFAILVACRVDAVAGAMKDEFDLDDEVWTVPAVRLKDLGRDLRVPLSEPTIALVRRQIGLSSSKYIFPGRFSGTHVVAPTILEAVQGTGWPEHLTTHGLARATFGTWAYDADENFRPDVIEMALAHKVGNETYEAYQRGDLFNKRRVMMDAWGKFVVEATGVESAAAA